MPRKVILDLDPGVDDAIALCLALADPKLEVVAVTATGGNIGPRQASRNVQALVEQLDPQRWPRIGAATPEQVLRADARHLYGDDGLCGAGFEVAELVNRHLSIKVLSDEIRSAPSEVTIIATGPLTNLAAVLQAEPDLATMIGHLVLLGGTVACAGNITPAAEFNIYCDPESARSVFRSPVTKTLIPLDVTQQIVMGFDWLERLKKLNEKTRTGTVLNRILPGAYRAYRQRLGLEGIHVHDVVAVIAVLHPELFTMERMHGDVECSGELTTGATVFDRRPQPDDQPNIDVAMEVDTAAVIDCLVRGIDAAP